MDFKDETAEQFFENEAWRTLMLMFYPLAISSLASFHQCFMNCSSSETVVLMQSGNLVVTFMLHLQSFDASILKCFCCFHFWGVGGSGWAWLG